MFRKMRRFKQQLPDEEAVRILENEKTGVLAVLGDDGYPYTVPLNYVYSGGKIYFHGAKEGHKLDAIRNCDKASFCVIAQDDVVAERLLTHFRSVIAFGRVRVLETDEEIYQAARLLGLKYNSDSDFIEKEIKREWAGLACIEFTPEHITGKEALELTKERIKTQEK